MEYVTKQCPVCGRQFIKIREAQHRVECCTLGCLDRLGSGVTASGADAQGLSG